MVVVWSLPNKNKNWVILSHFSLIQKEYKKCYPGKHVKETMLQIMLQEMVCALSNTQRPLRQVSIIKS